MPNHALRFRPLRAGIAIFNPNATAPGTLGLIATSDGQDRWMVSCYHVLCRLNLSAFQATEPIFQPDHRNNATPVAELVAGKADSVLDCAAARLAPGILATDEVLGLGRIGRPTNPLVGMAVVKSGSETGVTEGVITAVAGDRVTIELAQGFPADYELSEAGDSGAAWLLRDSMSPVAMHRSGNLPGQPESATAIPILRVLQTLGLKVI